MHALRNLAKAWLLLVGFCALFAAFGWALGGYRVASLFLFCALLSAGGLVFYADRVALGMVGARELTLAEPRDRRDREPPRFGDDLRGLERSQEVARVDGVELHSLQGFGERGRLSSPGLVQRRVRVTLYAALEVPVGLAVPRD